MIGTLPVGLKLGKQLNIRTTIMKNAMDTDDIMSKYCMSVDDVLNVRAIYGGTFNIAPDEYLGDVPRME